jgi:hypothetical protein
MLPTQSLFLPHSAPAFRGFFMSKCCLLCRTLMRGRIPEDGVIGLARSLILAGTPVVSPWQSPMAVSNATPATLMTEFYQASLKNPDIAQAIRPAMLTIPTQSPCPARLDGIYARWARGIVLC